MPERASDEERRERLAAISVRAVAEMQDIGVDRAFVSRLVDTFYDAIRRHERLGPVFDAKLAGHWDSHLSKMKRFWGSLAFKDGAYGGKPVAAHQPLPDLSPALFAEWLALFAATLQAMDATPAARDWFMTTADRIARSLMASLFYNPAEDDPARRAQTRD